MMAAYCILWDPAHRSTLRVALPLNLQVIHIDAYDMPPNIPQQAANYHRALLTKPFRQVPKPWKVVQPEVSWHPLMSTVLLDVWCLQDTGRAEPACMLQSWGCLTCSRRASCFPVLVAHACVTTDASTGPQLHC